jgi:predicted nucleic acid-binding protein
MTAADSLLFVDSNVLLYNVDDRDLPKQRAAHHWLDTLWELGNARLSWQVLNEFYFNATGKIGTPHAAARRLMAMYIEWKVLDFSFPLLQRAWYWQDHADIRYWDALILASAEQSGCRWLLSEDFQEGRNYGSVRAVNPFRTSPVELFGK